MVNSRRKSQGEIHGQEVYGMRPESLRPSQEIFKPMVPHWEKQFCSTVGLIPWRKFVEMKSYTHLYENVVKWNDSAGEEAFNDAKNRFWAKINGLPCDISLPDPDVYIDSIDWNSVVDPELVLDLEKEPNLSTEHNQDDNAVPLTEALLMNQPFSCTGWGETEEFYQNVKESQNPGIDPRVSNCDESKRVDTYRWMTCGTDSRKNNVTGWYDSRYKASRFPSSHFQGDHAYRERRNRVSFAHEKHALRQWAMKS